MSDSMLMAAYGPSHREIEMEKLAKSLSHLPADELIKLARHGNRVDPVDGRVPSIGQKMPPEQQLQGCGLGGQGPDASEMAHQKMAARIPADVLLGGLASRTPPIALDQASAIANGTDVTNTEVPGHYWSDVASTAGRGALIGTGLGAVSGAASGFIAGSNPAVRQMAADAHIPIGRGALTGMGGVAGGVGGAIAGGVGAGLGAAAGRGAQSTGGAFLRGAGAGAVLPAVAAGGDWRSALESGALGALVGGLGGVHAHGKRVKREQERAQQVAVLQAAEADAAPVEPRIPPIVPNYTPEQKALFDKMKMAAAKIKMAGALALIPSWQRLLRQNAVPLATGAAGAAGGAYLGGRNGGGVSGALGGAALGGVGGFVAGKGAVTALKGLKTQRALGVQQPRTPFVAKPVGTLPDGSWAV